MGKKEENVWTNPVGQRKEKERIFRFPLRKKENLLFPCGMA
jgi:hypothetical protein